MLASVSLPYHRFYPHAPQRIHCRRSRARLVLGPQLCRGPRTGDGAGRAAGRAGHVWRSGAGGPAASRNPQAQSRSAGRLTGGGAAKGAATGHAVAGAEQPSLPYLAPQWHRRGICPDRRDGEARQGLAGRFRKRARQRLAGGQSIHRHRGGAQSASRHRGLRQRAAARADRAEKRRRWRGHDLERLRPATNLQGGGPFPAPLQRVANRQRRGGGAVGSLTANQEWFKVWRTIEGDGDAPKSATELEVLMRGL